MLLALTNNTHSDLKDLVLKINFNLYGVNVIENFPASLFIPRGQTVNTKIKCSILKDNVNAQPPQNNMILIQIGLKTNIDVFYFQAPVLLAPLLSALDDSKLNRHELRQKYQAAPSVQGNSINIHAIAPEAANPQGLIKRMKENNLFNIFTEQNGQGGLVFLFYCETAKAPDEKMFAELTIQPQMGIQLVVKTLCDPSKSYMTGMMLQTISLLIKP